MSLRQGVTATEEHKLKALISQGVSWDEIVARCRVEDERGNAQVPLLADVDLETVKKTLYDPLVEKLGEAKEAGFKDIHSYEAAQRNQVVGGEERGEVADVAAGAKSGVDDLLGGKKSAKKPPKP